MEVHPTEISNKSTWEASFPRVYYGSMLGGVLGFTIGGSHAIFTQGRPLYTASLYAFSFAATTTFFLGSREGIGQITRASSGIYPSGCAGFLTGIGLGFMMKGNPTQRLVMGITSASTCMIADASYQYIVKPLYSNRGQRHQLKPLHSSWMPAWSPVRVLSEAELREKEEKQREAQALRAAYERARQSQDE